MVSQSLQLGEVEFGVLVRTLLHHLLNVVDGLLVVGGNDHLGVWQDSGVCKAEFGVPVVVFSCLLECLDDWALVVLLSC